MKISVIISMFFLAFACASRSSKNLPDHLDSNKVPAHLEQREEEVMNLPDSIDSNSVPAAQEKRLNKEENKYQEQLNDETYWE